jgi:hypothetical protein
MRGRDTGTASTTCTNWMNFTYDVSRFSRIICPAHREGKEKGNGEIYCITAEQNVSNR